MNNIRIQLYHGQEARKLQDDLARLRITVFREFPYLYEGDLEYEKSYMEPLLKSDQSIVVAAFAGAQIVGLSTGMPLADESEEIKQPWLERGDDLGRIFYFSESVLLKPRRGQGTGKRFFEERERWARQQGYEQATFCAVVRPPDHPGRPADYKPLDAFWRKRGFQKEKDLVCYISWKDHFEEQESPKPLQFWTKPLL